MTKDKLLNSICPMSRVYDCCIADGDYDCDKCKRLTKEWFDKYNKQVIEQYKADTVLKDTIREIHDRVAKEMYYKGIDDLAEKLKACCFISPPNVKTIERMVEELKESIEND